MTVEMEWIEEVDPAPVICERNPDGFIDCRKSEPIQVHAA